MTAAAGLADLVVERTTALAAIPAPPLAEQERARVVAGWWRADGLGDVAVDAVGNVWARVRGGADPAVVVCAHLDTVFGADTRHGVEVDGDVLRGPGVGDDSVAVAALGTLDALLPAQLRHPVWVLATVAEEGLGNLAGIRAALDDPPGPVGAVVAVEGNYLGRVCTTGVGSVRWRVEVRGPGGHAWEAADAPSAVHTACRAVAALAAMTARADARTSVNVGTVSGGEAINARARRATFEVDLRADRADALDALVQGAKGIAGDAAAEDVEVHVTELGRRPAGSIDAGHPLPASACAALRAAGIDPRLVAASTDANEAHARGIPAIAIGVTEGALEHTPQEWISVRPLATGLEVLAATVARYDRRVQR